MAAGRPTSYSDEIAKRICELVASTTWGTSRLCDTYRELPDQTTVYSWLYKYPEFSHMYKNAKAAQADLLAHECLDIADASAEDSVQKEDGTKIYNAEYVSRSKLRIDTRKWMAARLQPKTWGEKAAEATVPQSLVEQMLAKISEPAETSSDRDSKKQAKADLDSDSS